MDCIFCKIINGDIPSHKIYEDDLVLAFLDINPETNGHTLIIPKKHFKDLNEIEENELNHILKVAKELSLKIKESLKCDGFTLIQNNGFVQDVKHFHLHIVPKYINEQENLELNEIEKRLNN